MKTQKFTLLQLFSIVDSKNRLSTNIEDVYAMLNHIFDTSFFTHQLPAAMDRLREISPDWFVALKNEVDTICVMHEDDFDKIIEAIKRDYDLEFDIPQLTESEKS